MIYVDTREKPKAIRMILTYFKCHSVTYEVKKLDFGDYIDPEHPEIVIDRKQNIDELAKNVGTKDRERFKREIKRAQEAGAHLVILVEQDRYKDRDEWIHVETIADLLRWSSPYTQVIGEKVYRILVSWQNKLPISVVFCDKRQTGPTIMKILYEYQNKGNNNGN